MKTNEVESSDIPISFKSGSSYNNSKTMSQTAVIRDVKVVINYDIPAIKRSKPLTKIIIGESSNKGESAFGPTQPPAKSIFDKPKVAPKANASLANAQFPSPGINGQSTSKSIFTNTNIDGQSTTKSVFTNTSATTTPTTSQSTTKSKTLVVSGIELPKPLYQTTKAVETPMVENSILSGKRREMEELHKREEEAKRKQEELARANLITLPPPAIIVSINSTSSTDRDVVDYLSKAVGIKSETDFTKRLNTYKSVVDIFFFHKLLLIGDRVCRIVEVEFFQTPDPFTPQDVQLLTFNKFYFHRKHPTSNGESANNIESPKHGIYSKGAKRGIYITMGSATAGTAILIRSIYVCGRMINNKVVFNNSTDDTGKGKEELVDNELIEGSTEVVKYILTTLKHKSVELLLSSLKSDVHAQAYKYTNDDLLDINVAGLALSVFDHKIITDQPLTSLDIYSGPRVGLSLELFHQALSNPHHNQFSYQNAQYILNQAFYFIMAPLRFTCMPGQIKQYKHYLAMEAKRQFIPDAKIASDLKLNGEILAKWMSLFNKGSDMVLDSFLSVDYLKLNTPANTKIQLYSFGFFSKFTDSML